MRVARYASVKNCEGLVAARVDEPNGRVDPGVYWLDSNRRVLHVQKPFRAFATRLEVVLHSLRLEFDAQARMTRIRTGGSDSIELAVVLDGVADRVRFRIQPIELVRNHLRDRRDRLTIGDRDVEFIAHRTRIARTQRLSCTFLRGSRKKYFHSPASGVPAPFLGFSGGGWRGDAPGPEWRVGGVGVGAGGVVGLLSRCGPWPALAAMLSACPGMECGGAVSLTPSQ